MPALLNESSERINRSHAAVEPVRGRWRAVRQSLQGHWGWMLSLLLVGVGAKFWLIQRSGSPLPYFDQWDGEAAAVYIPYLEHQLSVADLFRAHNEHRIFFTHAYNLLLLVLNGQWDGQLQMVVNAVIHCMCVAGFGWLMARLLGRRKWPFIWPLLALALVLPFAWENTLWGFQSQFYFLLIASLLTLWWLGVSESRSSRWWWGVIAGTLGLFTVASGFLAAAAVLGLAVLDILKQRRNWRRHMPTLVVCALIMATGLLVKVHVPQHDALQAHSVHAFLIALGKNLAWPSVTRPWLAFLNVFPLLGLGWIYLRSKDKPDSASQMILGVGIWAVLQSLAIAYARGGFGNPPDWRYMDASSFIMIANGLSILLLLARYRERLRFAPVWYAGFAAWLLAGLSGLWLVTDLAEKFGLPPWKVRQSARLANARAFIATDDEQVFEHKEPSSLPFPYVAELVFLLRTPDIRTNLPACVREPLRVLRKAGGDGSFQTNGWTLVQADAPTERSWGSYTALGAGAHGTFESLPVQKSALPYLEIPVAGHLGEAGVSLELVDITSGRITAVRPSQVAGERWVNAYVRAPAGEFKIVARDESGSKWFAFKEPREVGRLSFWAIEMVAAWKGILAAGAGCFALNLAFALKGWLREKPHPSGQTAGS
jgi:hypothetical protein